tara:strand:+ start:2605 stop:3354 length:750 start_codon:yes stop_codon:yes gene_type:complete
MSFNFKELLNYLDRLSTKSPGSLRNALGTLRLILKNNIPFNHPRVPNNTGAVVYSSIYTLEKEIGIPNSTINDHLNILESHGYIWRLRRENKKHQDRVAISNGFPSAIYIFPLIKEYNSGFLKDIKEANTTQDFRLIISKYVIASTNYLNNPDFHINGESEVKYRKSHKDKKYLEIMISGLAHLKMYTDNNSALHKLPFYKCKLKCDIIKIYMRDSRKTTIPSDAYSANKIDVGKQYASLIKFNLYNDH